MTMADLPDFELDTALSADLDGELDAYAHELGTDADALRSRLATDPDADQRRRELQEVRNQLGAPVPPLDDLQRARLLAGAVAGSTADPDTLTPSGSGAADSGSQRPAWLGRAAAAAVLVLALGGGVLALTRSDTSDSTAKSTASGASPRIASGDLGDLGEVSREQLDSLIGGPKRGIKVPDTLPREFAADSAVPEAGQSPTRTSESGSALKSRPVPSHDELRTCRSEYEKLGSIAFSGSATYAGQPAVVLGLQRGPRIIVFVVAADDCTRVLLSVSRAR